MVNMNKPIPTMEKREIKEYLRAKKIQGSKFYVHRKRLGESALKAVNFDLKDIDNNDELVNYFLQVENNGDKIFVRNTPQGIRRVSFFKKQ